MCPFIHIFLLNHIFVINRPLLSPLLSPKSNKENPKQQFPPAPRISSCEPASWVQTNKKNSALLRVIIGDRVRISLRKRETKKNLFLAIFLLTLFVIKLKYPYVCQQANINRQQAKMTFQLACRKWLSHKDLEPAGPDS